MKTHRAGCQLQAQHHANPFVCSMRDAPICTEVKVGAKVMLPKPSQTKEVGQGRNPGVLRHQRPWSQREGSGLMGPSPVGTVTMDKVL